MVLRLPSDELPELDPLGLDGWELVTTTNTKPTKRDWIFKRSFPMTTVVEVEPIRSAQAAFAKLSKENK